MKGMILMGSGQLTVKVTDGGVTLPIEGAIVTVSGRLSSDSGSGVIYSLRTDESGTTETVELPAPDAASSLSPGGETPYGVYDVRVTKPGYISTENAGTQIFDGVTAIQRFSLIPESEFAHLSQSRGNIISRDTGRTVE